MRTALLATLAFCIAIPALTGEGSVAFSSKPAVGRPGDKFTISFAVDRATDVEVAILDAKSKVVRHLAAGVLGAKEAPPAPLKAGLAQSLEWDGRDDYGEAAKGGPFKVRVRAGMGARLEKVVGGDPYAFFSRDTNHGNHAFWYMGGLEFKPDGTVYVAGSQNQLGTHTIRHYDADGNYLNTVFPPPAGKPVEKMKGWGLNFNADGSYTPKYGRLDSPFMSTTPLCTERVRPIRLIASGDNDKLTVMGQDCELAIVNTDGTIAEPNGGCIVTKPDWPSGKTGQSRFFGPLFTCLAPDGKHFYLSGTFVAKNDNTGGTMKVAEKDGFWKDGQVWKIDVATREARLFFSLDKVIAPRAERAKSPIGGAFSYSELHGVAADDKGHVFVCDRLNKRVIVLDREAKILREIPVLYPDDIVLGPEEGVLYVTTRFGEEHIAGGELKLLKFADWRRDTEPAIALKLIDNRICYHKLNRSHLLVARGKDGPNIWVVYKDLPVRIYRDRGNAFELVKDFYEAGTQRCLSLYHMRADPTTENVYVSDGYQGIFRLTDWSKPELELCRLAKDWPLDVSSFAIDPRNRYLYGRIRGNNPGMDKRGDQKEGIGRYRLDGEFQAPAPLSAHSNHVLTEPVIWNWVISYGCEDFGMDVAPNGQFAALGGLDRGKGWDFAARLLFFKGDYEHVPWSATELTAFGPPRTAGGVRFDLQGNLYAGCYDGKPNDIPKGFADDRLFANNMLRIHKYAPTGSLAQGDLFPTQPRGPAKVYDVHFGAFGDGKFRRSARFGVDGYGRIYYPTSLSQTVSVIDNQGNPVLSFGTYGNRDSTGGLPGDLVPTKGIPMAYPNSVDATDDYIYVADLVNARLLRLAKTFAAEEAVDAK